MDNIFVIAEAGINHNGDIEIAKQLVDIVKNSRADAIKFQTFIGEEEKPYKNISYEETKELKAYCDIKDIIFLSTPHSYSAIDFLEPFVPVYKIASPYITDTKFIHKILEKKKPLIVGTGSLVNIDRKASYGEINKFLSMVDNRRVTLLYCESRYPTLTFSKEEFGNFLFNYQHVDVGFSCHSPDIKFALEAVEKGAMMIEKHITIDKEFDCPDKDVSIDPMQLETLVNEIRSFENKRRTQIKDEKRKKYGNSVYRKF